MRVPAAIGPIFLGFLAGMGRLGMLAAISVSRCVTRPFYLRLIWPRLIWRRVADDNLHPSENVHTPWADTPWAETNVPLVKSASFKAATP